MSVRRILHITTFLQGGAGRVVADLACAQRAQGWDVAVACAAEEAPGYAHYPGWLQQLASHDVPVLPVACTFRRGPEHVLGAVEALGDTFAVRRRTDIVHAHAAIPALVGMLLPGRPPVLATMHGWNASKQPAHIDTDRVVFNRLPVVAVPSGAAARHLHDIGVHRERTVVVPYGVAAQPRQGMAAHDLSRLARWRREGRCIAVCVGTVGTRKRQADVVQALAAPGLRGRMACVFIGEGPTLDAHAALAARLGIGDTAVFVGYRSNVSDWLRACDVTLFPSSREGLPIGLLEAAALRARVVVSAIDEHLEVVVPGVSGLAHAVGDVAGLVRTLERMLDMPPTLQDDMAAFLHASWTQRYQPVTMHEAYGRLYDALEAQPPARDDRSERVA